MQLPSPSHLKRFLIAAGVALAIPLSAVALQGYRHPGPCGGMEAQGHPGPGPEKMPPHLRDLSLTEAQRDKVFEIMHGQAPAMRDKAKALHQAEGELRALAAGPDYNEGKARVLTEAVAKAMSEMTLARLKAERQVYEILTPEQRKQMLEARPSGEPSGGRAGEGRRG